MSWNPVKARQVLDSSKIAQFIREVDKVAGYELASGRELALIKENEQKVAIYVAVAPRNMPDVLVDREYMPTANKGGRNADVGPICQSLGFDRQAYSLHVKSEEGLLNLLNWYQYA